MNVDDLVAIDIHTHAEEPCCGPRDDGYDEFQAALAAYFRNPAGADHSHLPTVEETAKYYRERRIGAVIFPVDAERETGFRRYSNEEVARIAAEIVGASAAGEPERRPLLMSSSAARP